MRIELVTFGLWDHVSLSLFLILLEINNRRVPFLCQHYIYIYIFYIALKHFEWGKEMFVCRQKERVAMKISSRSHSLAFFPHRLIVVVDDWYRRRRNIIHIIERGTRWWSLTSQWLLKIGGVIDVDDTHQWAKDNLAERLSLYEEEAFSLLFGRDGCS